MEVSHVSLTTPGPLRKKNEDYLGFWEPEDPEEKECRGSIAILADGVGGHGNGEIASRMAVEIALDKFKACDPEIPAKAILKLIFDSANIALYDSTIANQLGSKMATTLTVCIFREKKVHIGHVGDCRVYMVRHEEIKKLTSDHSYTGLQVKLRLISEDEARASNLRSMLTKSVGTEPILQFDYKALDVRPRDRFLQCCDGLYCFLSDAEILEGVDRLPMEEICPYLISLAERRAANDNLSAQVVQVNHVVSPGAGKGLSFLSAKEAAEAAPVKEVKEGDVLDERFLIEQVLSRSGMASIFRAKDLRNGEQVAVKVPFVQREMNAAFFTRFEREEEIGRTLKHPYILRFIQCEGTKSRPYIVTEYLSGCTLSDTLSRVRPLPIPDALRIASQICDALAHMHGRKIIHRDLKPQNIMVCDDGNARIIDFGIAKAGELRQLTFAGFSPTMGTPDYMAPEQVKGRRGDERTDIYSLGAMLYEMVTGSAPFEGQNPFLIMNARLTGDPTAPRKLNAAITPQLEETILHAMARDPDARFQSVQQMKAELDDPASVKVTGRAKDLKEPKPWETRWRGSRLVITSALVPILIFLFFLWLSRHNGHH